MQTYFLRFLDTPNILRSLSIAILASIFIFMLKIDLGNAATVQAPFLLYLTAIMISTWIDGLLAGVTCTLLSSIIILFFFLPPYNSFAIASWNTLLQFLVFIVEGISISVITTINKTHRSSNQMKTKNLQRKIVNTNSILQKIEYYIPHKSLRYFFYVFFVVYIIFILKLSFSSTATTSFVDALNNYVAGYFMLKGKTLYSQIFFNHQMLAAYVSYIIQAITRPTTLTRLIIYHRFFILAFSLVMDFFIIRKFKLIGIGFVLFYELIKYYFFGNFFLGESFIAYLVVYLFGLAWWNLHKRVISNTDLVLSGIFTWAIIFLREPYIPLALCLYVAILWKKSFGKYHILSVGILLFLSVVSIVTVPINDYLFQVVYVNLRNNILHEILRNKLYSIGLLKIFFYPVFILFGGLWNIFRFSLAGLDLVFLFVILAALKYLRDARGVIFTLFVLALSAIRFTPPGLALFGAFHLLPWISIFIFSIFIILSEIYEKTKNKAIVDFISFLLLIVLSFLVLTFRWFFTTGETIQQSFNRNYGRYYSNGEVIKLLAKPNSTLFVDWWDSLVYWVADIPSSYKYTFYYPVQVGIPLFDNERMNMFYKNPPDFYYTDCEDNPLFLPGPVRSRYIELVHNGKPGCVYVKRNLVTNISKTTKIKMKKLGFTM